MTTAQTLVAQAKAVITEIDQNSAVEQIMQPSAILLDVREPDEYRQGHLEQACNLPRGLLEFKITDIAPDTAAPVVIYCQTGGRAALAAKSLQDLGYNNVSSIAGGFAAWAEAGLPTVMPKDINFY